MAKSNRWDSRSLVSATIGQTPTVRRRILKGLINRLHKERLTPASDQNIFAAQDTDEQDFFITTKQIAKNK
jgi:hypothetical protein